MLTIDARLFYFAAILFLIIPASWLLAAVIAALFHELCHLMVIVLLGEAVHHIHISLSGIEIQTSFSGIKKELLAALAGPLGSFSLLLLCHVWPHLALCAFAQGVFNLLPLYPLDGGRILLCILRLCVPTKAEKLFRNCTIITMAMLLVLGVAGICYFHIPVLTGLILLLVFLVIKIPCKGSRKAVQ